MQQLTRGHVSDGTIASRLPASLVRILTGVGFQHIVLTLIVVKHLLEK